LSGGAAFDRWQAAEIDLHRYEYEQRVVELFDLAPHRRTSSG